jgi:hypothetical protein
VDEVVRSCQACLHGKEAWSPPHRPLPSGEGFLDVIFVDFIALLGSEYILAVDATTGYAWCPYARFGDQ